MTGAVDASVVIRAYNEERDLPVLLDRLAGQDHPSFEVIVVDSGSYDRTPAIAEAAGARLIRIESRDFTFGYSLNVGIRAANGHHVVIVSAHTCPVGSSWLSSITEPLERPDVAMVFGRQLGTEESKFGERMDFVRDFDDRPREIGIADRFVNNANSAIRRELWEERPFDEFIPGLEDQAWAHYWLDRGMRVVYEPEAAIYHIHRESWTQVRRRYFREAEAAREIGLLKGRDAPGLILREASRFAGDLRRGVGRGVGLGEIARFRWNKALGTIQGLRNGTSATDEALREAFYFNRSYPAVRIEERGRAELVRLEIPHVKPGDVLIEVAYEGVCGTDLEILSGSLGYFASGRSRYPIVPGHEFAGWVSRVGANVEGVSEGDRVVVECIQGCGSCEACEADNAIACRERREVGVMGLDGGYARYVLVPAPYVHVVPEGLDLKRAALTEPLAVVLKGVRRLGDLGLRSGSRVGVLGAGPIGHLAALAFERLGHAVVAYDRSPNRLAAFASPGIGVSSSMEPLRDLDVVVEATGDPDALHQLVEGSRPGTMILLLGLPYARRPFTFEQVVAYDRAVVGSVGSAAKDFDDALDCLPELRVDPFLEREYPLEEYTRAWEAAGGQEALKVMLRVAGE